jgi:orotidine-5'-phosphate decarboxylase
MADRVVTVDRPGGSAPAAVRRGVTPIVALDVSNEPSAFRLVDALGGLCRFYKVGAELFTAVGPSIVRALTKRGCQVFLDLKLHDIPNTVRGGCRNAAQCGARIVTVHAVGGREMIAAAVLGASEGNPDCEVFAVTVLTSLDAKRLAEIWGKDDLDVGAEVVRLATIARSAGAQGVVCGGGEVARVRSANGDALAILVPGVRLEGSATDDQQRVTTVHAAAAAGADYVVVGRTVTSSSDPQGSMQRVVRELA